MHQLEGLAGGNTLVGSTPIADICFFWGEFSSLVCVCPLCILAKAPKIMEIAIQSLFPTFPDNVNYVNLVGKTLFRSCFSCFLFREGTAFMGNIRQVADEKNHLSGASWIQLLKVNF